MKTQLHWAIKYKIWTDDDWEKVMFTYETQSFFQGYRKLGRAMLNPKNWTYLADSKISPGKVFCVHFTSTGPGNPFPV